MSNQVHDYCTVNIALQMVLIESNRPHGMSYEVRRVLSIEKRKDNFKFKVHVFELFGYRKQNGNSGGIVVSPRVRSAGVIVSSKQYSRQLPISPRDAPTTFTKDPPSR